MAASAMMSGTKRIDDIANNIANINTVGFKKDTSTIQTFSKLLQTKLDEGLNIGNLSNQVYIDDTYTKFTDGIPTETNIKTDFMLKNDGFFKIQKNGMYMYTRNGAFNVDAQGYLVTKDGGYVMDKNNQRVMYKGNEDKNIQDELNIVTFENKQTLTKTDNSYFLNTNNLSKETQVTSPEIHRGWLEMSNVDASEEMTDLIQAQRYYQINSKSLTTNDELLDKLSQF